MDHTSGLTIVTPDDAVNKLIIASNSTINAMRDHLFNGQLWPNLCNEGINPLGKYIYHRLHEVTNSVTESISAGTRLLTAHVTNE
jgi:3',5'-cyclic-nucleotide phosphodiesterase